MTIFSEFGLRKGQGPLANARGFALEQLVSIHSVNTDLRLAMVELVCRSFTAMCVRVQRQLVSWVRRARTPRAEEGHGRHCCC
jgi:hypothetical protein